MEKTRNVVNVLDMSSHHVVGAFHGDSQVFLVVVEQGSVGHDDKGDLIAQGVEDGSRAWASSVRGHCAGEGVGCTSMRDDQAFGLLHQGELRYQPV
jgi:hypothetical protein